MGIRHQHDTGILKTDFMQREDIKTTILILGLELVLYLFVIAKGFMMHYLPIMLLLMAFTVVGCLVAFHFNADRKLLAIVIVLLNMGFLVQELESGTGLKISSFLPKLIVAIVTAFAVAVLYKKVAYLLYEDKMVLFLMIVQIAICVVMPILGKVVGDKNQQGATIQLGGITPFEIVKVLYVFVAANLLCKEEEETISIFGRLVNREKLLIGHTIVLAVFFVVCKELGTLMVIFFTGLALLWIFGKNRKAVFAIVTISVVGFLGVWFLCDKMLYPMIVKKTLSVPGIIEKLIARFGAALHPEKYTGSGGYQGWIGLQAIAMGGLFGIDTERYRLPLPLAESDFIFANFIQTCGLVLGVIMIIFFFALLKRGMEIAETCESDYFKCLVMAITFLISIETVVHIGYNIACFPITGIPLYFVSHGFTAIVTGMALIAMLLAISTGEID